MSPEKVVSKQSIFKETDKGSVRSVSQMISFLPEINPNDKRFVEVYTRVQLIAAEKKLVKARRLSHLLDAFTGFQDFERGHEDILAAIELAVRGETRRKVRPALLTNHS